MLYRSIFITFTLHITDDEPPVVTCPNNVTMMNVDAGMADASVTWSASPSAYDVIDGVITPTTIICEVSPGNAVMSMDRFPVGTTTVTCRANDTVPNEGSCQFYITVVGRDIVYLYLKFMLL